MSFPGERIQPEMTALIELSPTREEKYYVSSHLWKLYQSHTCNRVCVCVVCVTQKWKHVCRTTQRLTKGEVRDTGKHGQRTLYTCVNTSLYNLVMCTMNTCR